MSNSYNASLPADSSIQTPSSCSERPSKKRKRGPTNPDVQEQELTTLKLKNDGSDELAITLIPIAVIPKKDFPLSFLDPSRDPARLFRANIKSLECGSETNHVLVTSELKTHTLYVVERVKSYTYALSKLSPTVNTTDVDLLCDKMPDFQTRTYPKDQSQSGGQWWEDAAVASPLRQQRDGTAPRKAPRLSMYQPSKEGEHTDGTTRSLRHSPDRGVATDHAMPLEQTSQDNVQSVSQEEVFGSLVAQYLEMLYRSRTSLAYFAKGPVSRTRATFGPSTPFAAQDLVDFYNGLVMSSSTADKKHREVLPQLIRDLPLAITSDHEKPTTKSKKKKKKKPKMDKKGLLPDEMEHLIQWWKDDESLVTSGESVDQRLKKRSLALRTRETFLQIILILEILALDSSDAKSSGKEDMHVSSTANDEPKQKPRKSQNHNLALEILLDKLTIWHSLDHGPIASDAKKESNTRSASNPLAEFCVEVIIPFYASRIPETAATVNKKLGGPTAPSPVKTKSKSRKPGDTETRKPAEKRSRDSLHRISSERHEQLPRTLPSLQRSSTDSILMLNLKRESSEIPLDQIPRKMSQPQPQPHRSASALDKSRIRQRTMDFSAMSQAQEAKKKKQADVEEKLRDAISGLRKPNRDVASKALAEATEQRQIIAQARAKASQLQRQRSSNNVQIDATPKHVRTKMITATPNDHHNNSIHIPSSSIVPSSSMRPPPAILADDEVPQTGHRPHTTLIQTTPTRIDADSESFIRPSLPTVRPFALAPSRNATAVAVPSTPSKSKVRSLEILETPEKKRTVDFVDATPVRSASGAAREGQAEQGAMRDESATSAQNEWKEETNIYAALGWE
ncbi:hypothetical protein MBLNU457_5589t1 [Dothideomycetes sp. NU457]